MDHYTLTVTPEELNIIGAALNELPRKVSNAVFVKLTAQVDAQEKERAAQVAAEAKAKEELVAEAARLRKAQEDMQNEGGPHK